MLKKLEILRLDCSCFQEMTDFETRSALTVETSEQTLEQQVITYRDTELKRLKSLLQSIMPA